jgi:hypothetical protein
MIPSRDRPDELREAVKSVADTSTLADVIPWIDDDQGSLYRGLATHGIGPRIGPVAAANEIVKKYPDYSAYGLITDDSRMISPGWDEWMLDVMGQFPNRICIVSPAHNLGGHVDMPFVSREWIETVGWFAYPDNFHYMWPIITGLIGEMTCIVHAPHEKVRIHHLGHPHQNYQRWESDAKAFFRFVSLDIMPIVERLRARMAA